MSPPMIDMTGLGSSYPSGWISLNWPQLANAKAYVGGIGMLSKPAALAAAASWKIGLSSLTALAKFDAGPRSSTTVLGATGLPTALVSTAIGVLPRDRSGASLP